MSDDQIWTPATAADVTDDKLVAGQLRALQRDVNDRLDRIGRALEVLVKIDAKLDVVIDRQNETDRRMDAIERRVAALEALTVKDRSRAAGKK